MHMSHRTRIWVLAVCLALLAGPVAAGTISLQWDPVLGATGYRVYYGTSSGQYGNFMTVGNVNVATVTGLADCAEYFLAIKAFNFGGESAEFSEEISGWARPQVDAYGPAIATQGSQFTLDLSGANFDVGATLALDVTPYPVDVAGNPLIRLESVNVLSCNQIQALVTVEPLARGFRAMEVGDLSLNFEIVNPDSVFGLGAAVLEILFNPSRLDINRSDATTTDRVDGKDLVWLAYAHGSVEGQALYNPDADLNGDGWVDGDDLAYLAADFGRCWSGTAWSASACP